MDYKEEQNVALVTGSAGFVGYYVSKKLLDEGWRVIGVDCLSDYYDVALKKHRESFYFRTHNIAQYTKKLKPQVC